MARLFYPLPRVEPAWYQKVHIKLPYGVKFGASCKRNFSFGNGLVPILGGGGENRPSWGDILIIVV
eukprot:COSAG04_NODE_16783_length_489_cov_0.910256_1_plen_65_part_10